MERAFTKSLLLTFLFLVSISCSKSKEEAQPDILGKVSGTVYNEFDQPLDDVTIKIKGNNFEKSALTVNGGFSFKNLKVGQYVLSASMPNFLDMSSTLNITDEQEVVHDVHLKSGDAYLQISDSLITSSYQSGSAYVNIKSNTTWAVHSDVKWVTLSETNGAGSKQIRINWSGNESMENRASVIEISAGSISKIVKVTQSSKLRIISSVGLPGNGAKEIEDSVFVKFNKEVKVKRITPRLETCQSSIEHSYTKDKSGVKFSYACAKLGGTYSFDIVVEDTDGISSSESIQVDFFTKELKLQGRIVNYFVDEDDNSYWVLTAVPNIIYKVSMEDLSVKHKFNISYEPSGLALNYATGELYVYNYSPEIHVHNINSGALNRVIKVPRDEDAHPNYSKVYIYDLEFTKSGLGVLLTKFPETQELRWWMIDSRKNDLIYKDEQRDLFGLDKFGEVHVNYDKSKLFLSPPGSHVIVTFDQQTQKFTQYVSAQNERGMFIKPNRRDNSVYSGQQYNQFVVNLASGYKTPRSQFECGYDASADFSYKANETDIIYFCNDEYLRVVDYRAMQIPTWYSVVPNLRGATSTTDGRYLLIYKADDYFEGGSNFEGDGTPFISYIYQFSTDIL